MHKTVIFYTIMIFVIAGLAVICNIQIEAFSSIRFSHEAHILIETFISIILILICLKLKKLYSETKDERFLILLYGFLVGIVFNLVHIFTVKSMPYDNLFFNNLVKKPTLIYLFYTNLILPLSIFAAIIHKTHFIKPKGDNTKAVITNIYLYGFILLALFPIVIYFFLPQLLYRTYLIIHTLQYINYALYLITVAILIDIKLASNQYPFNSFITGLLVLGFAGLFYISLSTWGLNGMFGHIFQLVGFTLVLLGLSDFQNLAFSLRVKDNIVACLSLLMIAFYIIFIPVISSLYGVLIPKETGYMFIISLLIFQLVLYGFTEVSWEKVMKVYAAAERDKSLVRVLESMRRVPSRSIIKNTILHEINKYFKPDKSYIVLYNPQDNSFNYDTYAKNLPSRTLENNEDLKKEIMEFKEFKEIFNNIEINFADVNEYIDKCSLKDTPQEAWLKDSNIQSMFTVPIDYPDKLLGYLILQYKNDPKIFNREEIAFLNKMASQIAVAITDETIS